MNIWLGIYMVGLFVAMAYGVYVLRDDDKRIGLCNLTATILLSTLSWVTVLALWIGQNIKNAVEEKDWLDDDDDNDFYNNDYDGF
jgi:hypothetical protein